MDKVIIPSLFDGHAHLREGELLETIVHCYKYCNMVVAMANLSELVITGADKIHYDVSIRRLNPKFQPIIPIMIVEGTTPQIITEAFYQHVQLVKMIPKNTSTGSAAGINLHNLEDYYPVFRKIKEKGMIFSGHWELAKTKEGLSIPLPEREESAIPFLAKLVRDIPGLKIVVEHVSTRTMIEFIKNAPDNVAATLTPQHAVLTTEDVLNKKGEIINPLNFCLPIAKSEDDRLAVEEAMVSGNPKFFFGSDSAPHLAAHKRGGNPKPGIFTAPTGVEAIIEIFEKSGAIDCGLGDFLSLRGHQIYGFPPPEKKITYARQKWQAPKTIKNIPVFKGGEELGWKAQ